MVVCMFKVIEVLQDQGERYGIFFGCVMCRGGWLEKGRVGDRWEQVYLRDWRVFVDMEGSGYIYQAEMKIGDELDGKV